MDHPSLQATGQVALMNPVCICMSVCVYLCVSTYVVVTHRYVAKATVGTDRREVSGIMRYKS